MKATKSYLLLFLLAFANPLVGALPEGLKELSLPDLSTVEPNTRPKITEAQLAFGWLAQQDATTHTQLVKAYEELGGVYLAAGLNGSALTCFSNGEKLDPEDGMWPHLLGSIAKAEGRIPDSARHFSDAVDRSPATLASRLQLGQILLVQRRIEVAKLHFEEALNLEPSSAFAHFGLGQVAMEKGSLSEAALHFEEASRLQPDALSLHGLLAMVYERMGEADLRAKHAAEAGAGSVEFSDPIVARAMAPRRGGVLTEAVKERSSRELADRVAQAREAVERDPSSFEARRGLADALAASGASDEAISQYRRALEIAPDNARTHMALGQTMGRASGLDEASFSELSRAVELAPGDDEVLLGMARALASVGRHADSIPLFDRAVQLAPDDLKSRVQRARALALSGRRAEAVEALREVLDDDPDWTRAHLDLGTILSGLGDLEGAETHLLRALDLNLDPNQQVLALFSLGSIRQVGGDLQGAISFYRQALELDAEFLDAHFNLATCLAISGRMQEAIVHFRRVTEIQPRDAKARQGLARAQASVGDWAAAVETLEKAVADFPGHPVLEEELVRARAMLAGQEKEG